MSTVAGAFHHEAGTAIECLSVSLFVSSKTSIELVFGTMIFIHHDFSRSQSHSTKNQD